MFFGGQKWKLKKNVFDESDQNERNNIVPELFERGADISGPKPSTFTQKPRHDLLKVVLQTQ